MQQVQHQTMLVSLEHHVLQDITALRGLLHLCPAHLAGTPRTPILQSASYAQLDITVQVVLHLRIVHLDFIVQRELDMYGKLVHQVSYEQSCLSY